MNFKSKDAGDGFGDRSGSTFLARLPGRAYDYLRIGGKGSAPQDSRRSFDLERELRAARGVAGDVHRVAFGSIVICRLNVNCEFRRARSRAAGNVYELLIERT